MLTAWWRKKATTVAEPETEPVEQPIRVGRAAVPDDAEAGYDREQWTFPFDDLSWTGTEQLAEPPPAFFAFDDAVRRTPSRGGPMVGGCGRARRRNCRRRPSRKRGRAWGLTAEYAPREVEPKKPGRSCGRCRRRYCAASTASRSCGSSLSSRVGRASGEVHREAASGFHTPSTRPVESPKRSTPVTPMRSSHAQEQVAHRRRIVSLTKRPGVSVPPPPPARMIGRLTWVWRLPSALPQP